MQATFPFTPTNLAVFFALVAELELARCSGAAVIRQHKVQASLIFLPDIDRAELLEALEALEGCGAVEWGPPEDPQLQMPAAEGFFAEVTTRISRRQAADRVSRFRERAEAGKP